MSAKRERALIFGNCQADALARILTAHAPFCDRFDIVPLKPIYLMTAEEKSEVPRLMRDVDLFLAQPAGADYLAPGTLGLKALMPSGGRTILFPVAWFNAYNPDMVWLRRRDGTVLGGPYGNYHSRIVVRAFQDGVSVSRATTRFLATIQGERVRDNFAANLAELRRREEILDITISDEIERVFRCQHLFSTVNHPNLHLQCYVADQTLDLLGLPRLSDDTKSSLVDSLGSVRWPINPSIQKALALSFEAEEFEVGGQRIPVRSFVERSFDFYGGLPPLDLAMLPI